MVDEEGSLVDMIERDALQTVERARSAAQGIIEDSKRANETEARNIVSSAQEDARKRSVAAETAGREQAGRVLEEGRTDAGAVIERGSASIDRIAGTVVEEVLGSL
jgi:vacuolar-type H+-ATPase subunit H